MHLFTMTRLREWTVAPAAANSTRTAIAAEAPLHGEQLSVGASGKGTWRSYCSGRCGMAEMSAHLLRGSLLHQRRALQVLTCEGVGWAPE
jgi:hypothetical protein